MSMDTSPKSRLDEARRHAQCLMDTLGRQELGQPLQERGWTFAYDGAKRRLGSCRWRRKGSHVRTITLSRHYVTRHGVNYRNEDGLLVLDDVIRHEIAHAIDCECRGRSDHGPEWQRICRRVGADPSRVYEGDDLERVPGKYVARCPSCRAERQYYRRPRRPSACAECCKQHNGGDYDERFKFELIVRATGQRVPYLDDCRGSFDADASTPAERGYKYTGRCPNCGWQTGYRRRITREKACPTCCRKHAGGRFDRRFLLRVIQNY